VTKIVRMESILTAPWTVHILFAAVRLRVFTILSDRDLSAEQIASECGAVPKFIKALLDACVSMGLLQSRHGFYANSSFGKEHLIEGSACYVGDLVNLQYEEFPRWYHLHDLTLGREIPAADDSPKDSEAYRTFIRAINNLGMLGEADALKDAVDLTDRREMVDVGGGSGLYSVVLCRANRQLRSTILDRKETLAIAEEIIASHGERERITLREADFMKDSFGQDIDLVLLSDVVYDQQTAAPVLQRARECLREGGLLVIRGYYSDPEGAPSLFGALFVFNELVFDPSREVLTLPMLRRRVADAGFRIMRASPLTERSSVVVATR